MKFANLLYADYTELGISSENWYYNFCLSHIFPYVDLSPDDFDDAVPISLDINNVSLGSHNLLVSLDNCLLKHITDDDPICHLANKLFWN